MTIAMPDSIVPPNMPKGYKAYLAYVDGERSKDADQVRAMFPGAQILTLTVLGGTAIADGCDREPGDLSPESAAAWIKWRASIEPGFLPVAYASRDAMPDVIAALLALGVTRSRYRILTAHYQWKTGTQSAHVCGPGTCGTIFTADGTQWSDSYPGTGGSTIDMSLLDDDFFGTPAPAANPTEVIMQQLPIVKQGATGDVVRTVQGLCGARGHAVTVDGVFGPLTTAAVKRVQSNAKIGVDGIVGPQTWPVLLGV